MLSITYLFWESLGSDTFVFFFECILVDCVFQEIPTNSPARYTCNDASIIVPTINTGTKIRNLTLLDKSGENSTKWVAEKGKEATLLSIKYWFEDLVYVCDSNI